MPLYYVTQVIYIPKENINMPSPEDETVSHPNYRVILYTQILFKMQSNFALVLYTYYAEELTSEYSSMNKPQYNRILTLCTCYNPPPSR